MFSVPETDQQVPPERQVPSSSTSSSEEPPPLHRLFVGSVPRAAVESTLRGYFEQCGDVRDLAILRDRSSGKSRGCAFVSYLELEEAEAAIQKFDRQLVLPGAQAPLEVRFAKNHSYVQAGNGPSGNRQLFFSRVPLQLKEEDIISLFTKHGDIETINIFKCRRSGRSKGCGFVEMQSRESAISAMEHLDEHHVFDATGTAMSVRWADPDLQRRKKKAMDDANADNRMLFFAKVLRSTTEEEVRRLFSRFGKVHDVNLFRAFQGAPTTKGCGLVTMSVHSEAVAVIAALDGKHVWDGMDCPMVVKWMDTALQRRRREQHLASMRQPLPSASIGGILGSQRVQEQQLPYTSAPAASLSGVLPLSTTTAAATATLPAGAAATYTVLQPAGAAAGTAGSLGLTSNVGLGVVGGLSTLGAEVLEAVETPPPGCNSDVIKLFVGNIPKSCTEDQLLPLFQSIGKVVELVIVYDKVTHESKGSAFVWYGTRADAERAIMQFNLRHVFPDPSGAQDRPLVVRRAKARNRVMGSPAVFAAATLGQAAPDGLSGTTYYTQRVVNVGGVTSPSAVGGLSMASLQAGVDGLQLVDQTAMGMGVPMGGPAGQQSQQPQGYLQPVTVIGAATGLGCPGTSHGMPGIITLAPAGGQSAGLYDAYGTGEPLLADYGVTGVQASAGGGAYTMILPPGTMGSSVLTQPVVGRGAATTAAAAGASHWDASGLGAQTAVSLALTQGQLAAVNQHLYSVQTVSGATMQLSAGSHGLVNLVISGGRAQVENARSLVATVVGGTM